MRLDVKNVRVQVSWDILGDLSKGGFLPHLGAVQEGAMHVDLADRTVTKGSYEGPAIKLQIGLEDVQDQKQDIMRGLAAA